MEQWQKKKHGVDPDRAKAAEQGVNKPAGEVLSESWENLKSAFTGAAKANTVKTNEKKKSGGYPRR